jgi:hypothetical protein
VTRTVRLEVLLLDSFEHEGAVEVRGALRRLEAGPDERALYGLGCTCRPGEATGHAERVRLWLMAYAFDAGLHVLDVQVEDLRASVPVGGA